MGAKSTRSKRRSGASSRSRQRETLVFFVDRSLGRHVVADTLRQAGANVEIHADHFDEDAPDDVWLTGAGKNQWIALTKDKGIRYNTLHIEALMNAKVKAFILTSGNLTGQQIALAFGRALAGMQRLAIREPAPFIARVDRNGRVTLWIDHHRRNRLGQTH